MIEKIKKRAGVHPRSLLYPQNPAIAADTGAGKADERRQGFFVMAAAESDRVNKRGHPLRESFRRW